MPAPTALKVPSLHPFIGRDLPHLVDAQAAQRPHAVFLVWESLVGEPRSWTFEEFAAETRAYAAGLASRGIGQGDFVVVHMDNCPEFLFIWVACARLGAVAVTTHTRSTGQELAYFVGDSGAVAAVTQPKYASLVREAAPALRWIACTAADQGEPVGAQRPRDLLPFENLRGDPTEAPPRTADPMLPCNVIYTSGTTSRPKGVVWTHANALWIASTTALHYQLTPQDVHPVYLPLFHTNALGLSFLATLWSGGKIVLMPRFSASRFWSIAEDHGCTWAQMVWFTLRAIAAQPDPATHRFRFWAAAGDMSLVRDRWGIRTLGIYGMTETVGLCVSSEIAFVGPEGAMGRPRPECEVALRDAQGAPVAVGEAGGLWVRGIPGLSLFYEYLNKPAETAAAFDADGWFDTGDIGTALADGTMFFVGRAKDILRVGGENVAPVEIEAAIGRVPGVQECAVVGKPDPMLDEVPVAFVVADQPGPSLEREILAHCAGVLSDFKRPREVRFIDALPKGLLDKILKNELRARLEAEVSNATSRSTP